MLAKSELKLETGEVIPLQFGMRSQRRFTGLYASAESRIMNMSGTDEQKLVELNFCIIAIALLAGYENDKINNGCFETLEQEFTEDYMKEKYPDLDRSSLEYKEISDERLFMVASRWVDLAGGADGDQVTKAIQTWNFFRGGEVMVEKTPPKKQRKSAGTKSKASQ